MYVVQNEFGGGRRHVNIGASVRARVGVLPNGAFDGGVEQRHDHPVPQPRVGGGHWLLGVQALTQRIRRTAMPIGVTNGMLFEYAG